MRISHNEDGWRRRSQVAFTLMEVIVCTAIIGIMFTALYAGMASGFAVVNLARENLRASQIILEKMETIRLYNWEQINSNGYISTSFTAPFFPSTVTNAATTNLTLANSGGLVYSGSISITNATVSQQYSNDMRLIIVSLTWTNTGTRRVREMETFVSKYGMQNYIY